MDKEAAVRYRTSNPKIKAPCSIWSQRRRWKISHTSLYCYISLQALKRGHIAEAVCFLHLAVDDAGGQIKFVDHAQGDGASARLGVVHLPLEQSHFHVIALGQDFCRTGTRRAATHHSHLVLHLHPCFERSFHCRKGQVVSNWRRSTRVRKLKALQQLESWFLDECRRKRRAMGCTNEVEKQTERGGFPVFHEEGATCALRSYTRYFIHVSWIAHLSFTTLAFWMPRPDHGDLYFISSNFKNARHLEHGEVAPARLQLPEADQDITKTTLCSGNFLRTPERQKDRRRVFV